MLIKLKYVLRYLDKCRGCTLYHKPRTPSEISIVLAERLVIAIHERLPILPKFVFSGIYSTAFDDSDLTSDLTSDKIAIALYYETLQDVSARVAVYQNFVVCVFNEPAIFQMPNGQGFEDCVKNVCAFLKKYCVIPRR